ncbi:cobaltochelatase subunit CobN [Methanoregula formicica]|uniref:Magnesium chelatase, H subunit n=1 Tax=Methanoregula formicica (strain DSM 22288 / NBRC 105244 / SMSP) TaxID=593750 RepID=L0HDS5_METFS|nr:cobaltochelatase subunit CobN [Methanoregula formicica]AGB01946.1 magnesium chelatase, H subunit [Methanoregula formicica SMSP]
MKVTSIMMGAYGPTLKRVAEKEGIDLSFFSSTVLGQSQEKLDNALEEMKKSDIILIHHSSELVWDQIDKELKSIGQKVPVVSIGDPSYWALSTVKPEIVSGCQIYFTYGGDDNLKNLLNYLGKELLNADVPVDPPAKLPWDGIYHPDAEKIFSNTEDYLKWYEPKKRDAPWVSVIFLRFWWIAGNLAIEDALIRQLESEGMNVIPMFTYWARDEGVGARGIAEDINHYLMKNGVSRVDAIIKLVPYLLGATKTGEFESTTAIISGIDLLKTLNIPIFQPVVSGYLTVEQWKESKGLTHDTGHAVAMPEFDGVIEPIYIGSSGSISDGNNTKEFVADRIRKVSLRVRKWIALAKKPVHERKVAFILNNSPCGNSDANIGGGAHFDSLESVARILQSMKAAGYNVSAPESGKELIQTIIDKRAKSEFRWTTIEDIVSHGGALMQMEMSTYLPYFRSLPPAVQQKMTETWNEPPGLGMVYDNKILIVGVSYGNATVHVQPKRGCYGARCDGEVCKILHDPDCPPTHQYLATYYWIEHIQKADIVIHVGTHGTLEFLPGKGLGLSEECYPDIAAGTVPYIYIYNSDNPPEGTIAKRRAYAVLCDHMQTVMTQGGLYEGLEELDNLLSQYETAKIDPARAHALQHLIIDAVTAINLDKDMHLTHDLPLSEVVSRAHEALSKIRNTQIQSGMHIFGELPIGDKRLDFINSIIRFDTGDPSARRTIAEVMGFDLTELLTNQNKYSDEHQASYGALLERLESTSKKFIDSALSDTPASSQEIFGRPISPAQAKALDQIRARILDINKRVDESREIESLLNGLAGGYLSAGPSGQISRGHEEVLPTGRNFYSLDPYKVPTKPAWRVGKRLAESILAKYEKEEGKLPENIGFYWMCTDVMSSDGEMYAQLMALLGVEPVWQSNGQVRAFSIIPLEKLGRPRIDVTIRSSGILRDNFSNCYELLDEAIQAVAALDEPTEQNFVRKHALEKMQEKEGTSWRDATLRIFSSPPGTYSSGVNLAVLASAWKTEADLADIFVVWNGYAYGKDIQGTAAHEHLASSLSTVAVTFNSVISDEYDLLGCCCYFGTQGGMTAAARHYSGKDVKPYYGDTREPENVEVRDLSDEIRRVVRTKLLNPKWIEGMKEHGYKGAADIMRRITHVYGWEASTQEVDDWIFDDIANTFVNDDEMREFFEENNPYALEEIARRLLEAEQRGLWDADEQTLQDLRNNYLEIESWMEDQVTEGDHQGGNVDIFTHEDVGSWGESMRDVLAKVKANRPH